MQAKQMMLGLLGSAVLGGGVAVGGYKLLEPERTNAPQAVAADPNIRYTSELRSSNYVVPEGLNFTAAAASVTPAVVHVMTEYAPKVGQGGGNARMDPFLRAMPAWTRSCVSSSAMSWSSTTSRSVGRSRALARALLLLPTATSSPTTT